ncbi:THC0290_0291 family protein [Aegicerativicinus sediminis]|uniref:THC0290_0291 family protein n=1 Tax=Aegicerativicinus sediminis TaxID=2893202 RepID=UPI001E5F7C62|nr:glutamate dehydrogenase [Aegicerativicinus sediminis]
MRFKLKPLALLIIAVSVFSRGYSQLGFSHEIGAIIGPVEFRSDFGQRNNEPTNLGNSGIGIGIIHYINFAYRADCNCYSTDTYWNDHFKVRSEISWNYTPLDHIGKFVSPSRTGPNAQKLRDHHGVAENFDVGMQLEYFPRSIRAFQAMMYKFAPFVSLGAHYTNSSPQGWTDYGDLDIYNPDNIYSHWWDPGDEYPIRLGSQNAWSVVASVGVRYKLTVLSDLMLDLRWQYYFSDWIDGFNHKLSYNKFNDWLIWLNFGYIYYLD